jgi:hypothetical protein
MFTLELDLAVELKELHTIVAEVLAPHVSEIAEFKVETLGHGGWPTLSVKAKSKDVLILILDAIYAPCGVDELNELVDIHIV